MGQIASFYTLDQKLSEALLKAARPERQVIERKFLFFTRKREQTVDNFWNFLKEQAAPQETFGYGGTGFIDLELVLEGKGVNLYKFSSSELAGKLAAARPSIVALFDHTAAANTINLLNEVAISKEEAQSYSKENFPKEDDSLVAESIISAYDIFKRWLGSVGEAQLGLLIIG